MASYTVTGGAGFIGSHLAEALLGAGHGVTILDDFSTGQDANVPEGARVLRGDVATPEDVAAALRGSDGCFHLAAVASVQRASEDWLACHRVNQTGTVAVLEAARAAGRLPVVYASSAAVYGDTAGAVATEALRPAPLTAYGADKLGSELHAAVGWRIHGVPSLGLRFFNVYGPRQDPHSPYSGVISIFARRARAGETLLVHGDGGQVRDFVHVSDVVASLLAAMRRLQAAPGAEVANVCTGRGTSILDLARLVARLAGAGSPVAHGPARAGDIRHSVGDPAHSLRLLASPARVELEEGLGGLV
jgi:UDP-glucose 4-epimerase